MPTPGSPNKTGLFFVRRDKICTTRLISSSRPITGSIFFCSFSSVKLRAKKFNKVFLVFLRAYFLSFTITSLFLACSCSASSGSSPAKSITLSICLKISSSGASTSDNILPNCSTVWLILSKLTAESKTKNNCSTIFLPFTPLSINNLLIFKLSTSIKANNKCSVLT